MIPTPGGGISKAELQRVEMELRQVQLLADGSLRGTSAGSVTRYALTRVGATARKAVRRSTPRRKGVLARSTRGRVYKRRRGGVLDYRVSWRADYLRQHGRSPLQAVAIEFGTVHVRGLRVIARALAEAAGLNGDVLVRAFVDEMNRRIAQLTAKANARAAARR